MKSKKAVKPIPAGYAALTPYLSIRGAARAIEFYKKAFDAKELMRMPGPKGKLGHAEVKIGDSRVMLADEYPAMKFVGPKSLGGSPVHLHIATHVEDVPARELRRRAAEMAKQSLSSG